MKSFKWKWCDMKCSVWHAREYVCKFSDGLNSGNSIIAWSIITVGHNYLAAAEGEEKISNERLRRMISIRRTTARWSRSRRKVSVWCQHAAHMHSDLLVTRIYQWKVFFHLLILFVSAKMDLLCLQPRANGLSLLSDEIVQQRLRWDNVERMQ